MSTYCVNTDELRSQCERLFESVGVSERAARINSDNLIDADLKGIHSHGVSRMQIYLDRLRSGLTAVDVDVEILRERPATLLGNARNGLGAVASHRFMELLIRKAKSTGIAFGNLVNSNHYSAAAYFAEMALPEGMIGFTASNGPARMAPWGGKEPAFGTSPFAVAIPAGKEYPIIADMASCVVARGKIILASQKGESIPQGWALDQDGNDTTDAGAALKGTVLPFGGPKGSAIATVIETMTGILGQSEHTTGIEDLYSEGVGATHTSHCFGAIDVDAFQELSDFTDSIDEFIRTIKSRTPVGGADEVFLPGEIELRRRESRRSEGIPLPKETLEDLRTQAEFSGISFDIDVREAR